MHNMGQKLAAAVRKAVTGPQAKATFPDGSMAAKDACDYCQALCRERGIKPPTLRHFKWHLRHGQLTHAVLKRSPFGNSSDKVHALTTGDVLKFVDALERQSAGDSVVETIKNAVASRSRKLSVPQALAYIQSRVGSACELNPVTFDYYVTYDMIPSRASEQGGIDQNDLDAFLKLAPSGVRANHMNYKVASSLTSGQMSLKKAYTYYATVDPKPVTLNTFRSLVAAGIVSAIRTENAPKAPIVGFDQGEINAFLARRQRIMEKMRKAASTKRADVESTPVMPSVAAAIEDALTVAQEKLGINPSASQGLSKVEVADKKPTHLDLQKAWPVETAYHKFKKSIPPRVSLLQFKRLVRKSLLRSLTKDTVVHVRLDAVEAYFQGESPSDTSAFLSMEDAYDSDAYDSDAYDSDATSSQEAAQGMEPVAASPPPPSEATPGPGTVSISMKSYSSPAAMKKALDLLISQGFEVDVKP